MVKDMQEFYQKYKEILRYVLVGVATTAISLGVYFICVYTILDATKPFELQIANVLSWIAAVTFSYFASRVYVFGSKNKNILREGTRFYLARVGSLLIDMAFMFIFVTVFHINDRLAKILVQFIVLVTNYILSKLFVFANTHEL